MDDHARPNQTLRRDRGRILVSRGTQSLQRPRRVNLVVRQSRPTVIGGGHRLSDEYGYLLSH